MAEKPGAPNSTEQAIRRMSRWVDNVLGQMQQKFCPAETWSPAVNLFESDQGYHMVVDLAGVQSDQIDLVAERDVLTLQGRRECPKHPDAPRCTARLMEIDHGRFCRKIKLPGDVDVDAIEARYRGGLLLVDLPKKA
jgi:HSP20 family protein